MHFFFICLKSSDLFVLSVSPMLLLHSQFSPSSLHLSSLLLFSALLSFIFLLTSILLTSIPRLTNSFPLISFTFSLLLFYSYTLCLCSSLVFSSLFLCPFAPSFHLCVLKFSQPFFIYFRLVSVNMDLSYRGSSVAEIKRPVWVKFLLQ